MKRNQRRMPKFHLQMPLPFFLSIFCSLRQENGQRSTTAKQTHTPLTFPIPFRPSSPPAFLPISSLADLDGEKRRDGKTYISRIKILFHGLAHFPFVTGLEGQLHIPLSPDGSIYSKGCCCSKLTGWWFISLLLLNKDCYEYLTAESFQYLVSCFHWCLCLFLYTYFLWFSPRMSLTFSLE